MRVRCSFCGAEYEAAVTRAALLLVARCEQCGRARLQSVDADVTGGEPDDARTDFCDPGGPGALA
jgi:hypothetical protein